MAEAVIRLLLVLFMVQISSGDQNGMFFTVKSPLDSANYTHFRIFDTTPYDESGHSTRMWLSGYRTIEFYGCDVDYRRRRFYVSEAVSSSLLVFDDVDLNVMNVSITKFHTGVTPSVYVKLAVDWISDNVYWLDQYHMWIAVQPGTNRNTDRTLYTVLVEEELDLLIALAIDPLDGYMFWSNVGKSSKIERSTLSGTDRQAIVSRGLGAPISIAVDHPSLNIYWVDSNRDTIERADYNGENRKTLVRKSHSYFFDIALYLDSIVVTEIAFERIMVFNKITGEFTKHYKYEYERYYGVSMFTEVNQPMAAENHCLTKNCDDICIGGGTSSAVCVCRTGWELQPDGRTCVERFGQYHRATLISNDTDICFLDKTSMISNDFNKTCLKNLVTGTNNDVIQFIDVDSNSRILVYATRYKINKANTKGENRQTLVTTTSDITGLTLDWVDENIYWSESSGKISVYSMESRAIKTVLSTGRTNPRNILVDPHVMKLFWIAGGSGNTVIEKANLDGSQRTVVVTSGVLDQPKSLVIDLYEQQLYWIDEGYIRRSNVDGTGFQLVDVRQNLFANPDRLLVYKKYLVWTETTQLNNTIQIYVHSKLSPSARIVSYGVEIKATDIKAMDPILQQAVRGPCDMFNGGCDHICIPVGNSSECQCEFGYEPGANGKTCTSTPLFDNFLLMTDWTHNRIYQVSLDTRSVQGLRSGGSGSPTGVTFDPVRGHVIWGETGDNVIKTMRLNGSTDRILYETGLQFRTFADRFAIDLSSGNAYYTSVNATGGFNGVAVVTLDGKHRKIITDGAAPRAIVLDQKEGVMFWTDHGEKKVWKAHMDGSNRQELPVATDLAFPNGIAIDYIEKMLYITDGLTNKIHRCSYTGACKSVYEDTGAWLMAIYLSGSFLYYTSWNNPFITKIDKVTFTNKVRLSNNPELGRLDDIFVYNSSEPRPPVHSICSTNNGLGPCSTFCFPRGQQDYACACEDGVNLTNDNKRCVNVPSTTTTTTTTSSTAPPISETTPPTSERTRRFSETTPSISETMSSTDASSGGKESPIGIPVIAGIVGGGVVIIVLVIIINTVIRRRNQTSQPPSYERRSPPVGRNNQPVDSTYDSIGDLIDLGVPDTGIGCLTPDKHENASTNNQFNPDFSGYEPLRNQTRAMERPAHAPEPAARVPALNTHASIPFTREDSVGGRLHQIHNVDVTPVARRSFQMSSDADVSVSNPGLSSDDSACYITNWDQNIETSDYMVPISRNSSSSNSLEMLRNLDISHLDNPCYDVTDYRTNPVYDGSVDRNDHLNPC